MARIVLIGEAMLELSRKDSDSCSLSYGGDTLNTAVHLARAGHNVAYLTAMGIDPFSNDLVDEKWRSEGLDTSLVLRHQTRGPGLYSITTDGNGERSFTYWRDTSAARDMFALPGIKAALATAEQADLIAYSLITLAILPPEARDQIFKLSRRVRARGGKVAFDGNYRHRLWGNVKEARAARDQAIACADIGLPTLEDECLLTGERNADSVAEHWRALGCAETIIKVGPEGARLPDGTILPPPEVLHPIDTSGAGDAFNGGYLASRMNGNPIEEAVMAGHRLAGWCVMRAGAIPANDSAATYA